MRWVTKSGVHVYVRHGAYWYEEPGSYRTPAPYLTEEDGIWWVVEQIGRNFLREMEMEDAD